MTTVGETNDELNFGVCQQQNLYLPTIEDFLSHWNNGQKAIAIMPPQIYAGLQQMNVPMRMLAQDTRRVVIVNTGANAAIGSQSASTLTLSTPNCATPAK